MTEAGYVPLTGTAFDDRGAAGDSTNTGVELRDLALDYGRGRVLHSVNLSIAPGELFCLLGPSGCGKTSTLNLIAGFFKPSTGDIYIGGKQVTNVPSHKRHLGMVFQSYALLPHMTVYDNVAFGPRRQRLPKRQVQERVHEALKAVRLSETADRYPSALSGGQQQRIGLARALAVRPKVLLLDEPLSNLDAKLRREMQYEIRRLHDEYELTSIYVTHDQEEAMVLGDRIAVMHGGAVEQIGAPREVYENAASSFVARFLGERNFFQARVLERRGEVYTVSTGTGTYMATTPGSQVYEPGDSVEVAIREESVRVPNADSERTNVAYAKVVRCVYRGGRSQLVLDAVFATIRAQIDPGPADTFMPGQRVQFVLPVADLRIVGHADPSLTALSAAIE